jgi:hypothetical protein
MEGFSSQFTHIKGISDRRRLPRLGKLRLGVKVVHQTSGKEYPKETPYFVVPPEVSKIYGDTPTSLDVMFPMNDVGACFPQMYCAFGKTKGMKCVGDGENAMRYNEEKKTMEPRDCPCEKLEKKECSLRAFLRVILPKVNMGGIYQVDMSSINSITDINSGIDYIRALMMEALGVDRFALIPLTLERKPIETHHDGKKQTHYTLRLYPNITIDQLNKLKGDNRLLAPPTYALPAPVIENPAMDDEAVVEVEEDEPERVADVGETSVAPPPATVSATVETEPPSENGPTEAEVLADLKKAGMVDPAPEEKPPDKIDRKKQEAQLLNDLAKEINKMLDQKTVNEWFGKNCLSWKKELSTDRYMELTKLVNDKLKSLKKK